MTTPPPTLPYFYRELKPRRNKYGNQKCAYKGATFDSKLELQRYQFLEAMQTEGRITGLIRQTDYTLPVNGTHVCTIRLDHTYHVGDRVVFEDAKGIVTKEWALKRKLFEAVNPGSRVHIVTKTNLTSLPDA
jgi:hypothetical protein